MKSLIYHFLNILSVIIPNTRFFGLKNYLYGIAGVDIGENVSFGNNIIIFNMGRISIGSNVWLGRGAEITVPSGSLVKIGKNVDIGPNVKFVCGTHKIGNNERRAGHGYSLDISIGDGTWIGTEVILLGGSCINNGTIIAAGSVVLPGVYPPNVLIAGNPAKIVKKLY